MSPGILSRFFEKYYAPLILCKPLHIVGIFIALVGMAFGIYGITVLKQESQFEDFYIDGTTAMDYTIAFDQYFDKSNVPLDIITTTMDYNDEDTQLKLLRLFEPDVGLLESNKYVISGTTICWYLSFREYALQNSSSNIIDPDTFYVQLNDFLASEQGLKFKSDIVFANNDDATSIQATRCTVRLIERTTNDESVDAMLSLRDTVDEANLPSKAFPYEFEYLFNEEYARVKPEAFRNVLLGVAVVFVVTLFLIGNLVVSMITFFGVAASVVDILGLLHYWNIHLNSVSVITLSLVIGLTIDFSAHIGVSFMESIGSRKQRASQALKLLGPPLLHGGISTFLAVSVLIFARSFVFKVFFKIFFLIVALGMFHGMVVVPQILYTIGPSGYYSSQMQKVRKINGLLLTYI